MGMILLSEVVVHLEYPELDSHLGGDGNQVAEVENSVVRGGMVLTGWAD